AAQPSTHSVSQSPSSRQRRQSAVVPPVPALPPVLLPLVVPPVLPSAPEPPELVLPPELTTPPVPVGEPPPEPPPVLVSVLSVSAFPPAPPAEGVDCST